MKKIITATLSLALSLVLVSPVFAQQGPPPAMLCGGVEAYFLRAVMAFVGFIGLAILFMLITGGFKLITSGGDPKATKEAQNTITYAIIGAALVVGAIFILRFIKIFTGVDVLTFSFCP